MLIGTQREVDRIHAQISRLETHPPDDWAAALVCQALCVHLSGALEVSLQNLLDEYCRRYGNSQLRRATNRYVSNHQNPKAEKIAQLLESFEPQWRAELESFWNGRIKDTIDSIVANRNNIAHGRPTGITPTRLKEFFKAFTELLVFLDDLILGAG